METKINNQEEYSSETLEYFTKVSKALHQSAKEAANNNSIDVIMPLSKY